MTRGDSAISADETRPRFGLRYDLRAPDFGAPIDELYATALDQCEWGEGRGFELVQLSEHHCSDDGYCPSPLVVAAAIAGRTKQMPIMVSALIAPLYDPVRLAEDLSVLDLVSGGRIQIVFGVGYRQEEYDLFGRCFDERVSALERLVETLRAAWSGRPFDLDGRTTKVLPRPLRPGGPPIILAGSTPGAARRAARIADGFLPVHAPLWQIYADECLALGREPGPRPRSGSPLFVHVTEDPERDWARIAPHALHEANAYGRWLASSDGYAPYTAQEDPELLRTVGPYRVVSPDECIEIVRTHGVLAVHPLMGGLSVDLGWASLELIAGQVMPAFASAATNAAAAAP